MINTSQDLKEYLLQDKIALGRSEKRPSKADYIWRYEIALRKTEYHTNNRSLIHYLARNIYSNQYLKLGRICGFEIPLNTIDMGLSIAHKGPIVINSHARIGKNCRLHICVVIGTIPGTCYTAPTIGDNVYIAPGAKIFGPISIADDTIIGANSVVNKSFTEKSICIAGVPAKKISNIGRTEKEKNNKEIYEKIISL